MILKSKYYFTKKSSKNIQARLKKQLNTGTTFIF